MKINTQVQTTCIFCKSSPITKEHRWGKWLIDLSGIEFNETTKTKHSVHGNFLINGKFLEENTEMRPGKFRKNGTPFHVSRKITCNKCNNGWLSAIEESMKGLFNEFKMGDHNIFAKKSSAFAVSRWCALKAAIWAHCIVKDRINEKTSLNLSIEKLEEIERDELQALFAGGIPKNYTIAICKLLPGNAWGSHYLQYAIDESEKVPRSMGFTACVGPLGFWVVNNLEYRTELISQSHHQRGNVNIIFPEAPLTVINNINDCSRNILEYVLYKALGSPKYFPIKNK